MRRTIACVTVYREVLAERTRQTQATKEQLYWMVVLLGCREVLDLLAPRQ